MKKRIIMQGDAKIVDIIVKENKIRAARGDVKFIEFAENEKETNFDDEEEMPGSGRKRKNKKEQPNEF